MPLFLKSMHTRPGTLTKTKSRETLGVAHVAIHITNEDYL